MDIDIKILTNLVTRFEELEKSVSTSDGYGNTRQMREYKKLSSKIPAVQKYIDGFADLTELQEIVDDKRTEVELLELAKDEIDELSEELKRQGEVLKISLLPDDPIDENNVIIEIRAGTGGSEAGLFAKDLFSMYTTFGTKNGFEVELIQYMDDETGLGSLREASFIMRKKDAYKMLKFEGGTHRVQRVPKTENSGRIHTSAATVVIIPEITNDDILEISEKDLRVDTFRASGAGGQSVQKTNSAIRLTHIPTGIVVQCQDERSQIQNKAKALVVLKSKIFKEQEVRKKKSLDDTRKKQVGTGDRSEKIRTYNFPEKRVTDHRINFVIYQLEDVLNGGKSLNIILEALQDRDKINRLENFDISDLFITHNDK
ncbi:MAG: peptide chain release factor 1 [Alphaproteobacteria bacterium]|nr:peptide chain release factor 1 [Alphaproteobacteria bacterium]MBL0717712.1 peptide chain release factor 1 [Alphaproteobacteria bacterium]